MPISLVGVFEGATNLQTEVTVNLSGTASGDVVYGFQKADLSIVGQTPTGYTLISGTTFSTLHRLNVYRKVLSAADSSVVFPLADINNPANCCVVVVLRGVDNTTPEDAAATTATGSSTTPDSPPITTVTNNAWVISAFGAAISDTTVTAPSGYSNQVDIEEIGDDTDGTAGAATKEIVSAGAEDPPSWTNLGSAAWAAISVAARPADGGTPSGKRFVLIGRK